MAIAQGSTTKVELKLKYGTSQQARRGYYSAPLEKSWFPLNFQIEKPNTIGSNVENSVENRKSRVMENRTFFGSIQGACKKYFTIVGTRRTR